MDGRPCRFVDDEGRTCGKPLDGYYGTAGAPHQHVEGAHPGRLRNCHTYTPKEEEPMRIATANVIVTQVARERRGTRVAVEWPKDGHNPPEPGDRRVIGWSFEDVLGAMLSSGPSPEEQAVIGAAKVLVDHWDRLGLMRHRALMPVENQLVDAVVALNAAKGGR